MNQIVREDIGSGAPAVANGSFCRPPLAQVIELGGVVPPADRELALVRTESRASSDRCIASGEVSRCT